MMVYACHQFGGDPANVVHVEKLLLELFTQQPEWTTAVTFTPASPLHALGFMYTAVDYDSGMKQCLELLNRCDCMLIFDGYSDSRGCRIEKDYCHQYGIPIIYYEDLIKNPSATLQAVVGSINAGYVSSETPRSRAFIQAVAQSLLDMQNNSVQTEEKAI